MALFFKSFYLNCQRSITNSNVNFYLFLNFFYISIFNSNSSSGEDGDTNKTFCFDLLICKNV